MKVCCRCKKELDFSKFGKLSTSKDGYRYSCKSCRFIKDLEYRINNREKCKLASKKSAEKKKELYTQTRLLYKLKNKELLSAKSKEYRSRTLEIRLKSEAKYRELNYEKVRKLKSEYKKRNKGKVNADTAKRHSSKLNATPPWMSKSQFLEIKDIYIKAHELNKVVDHVIPLQGKEVCGLHVPWNLQIIDRMENTKKGNKLISELATAW